MKNTEYVGAKLPKDMRQKLKETAQKNFVPESSIIKQALDYFFANKVKQSKTSNSD